MPNVISNTSPLQYLHQAGQLDLLRLLYHEVSIPTAVVEELSEGRTRGIALPDPNDFDWLHVREVRNRALLPLVADLGSGEREAIALALESSDSLLILDDRLARQHAKLLKLRITGTLGVLLKAKQEGHLRAIAPVLDRLDMLRFRLDPATRIAVLKLAGEAPTG